MFAVALTVDAPFTWSDPTSWPLTFWVWLAFILLANAGGLWRWCRRRSAQSWPTTFGTVDIATIDWPGGWWGTGTEKNKPVVAEIVYMYSAEGQSWTGRYQRAFATDEEADEFTRDLKGRVVTVQYNPRRSGDSMLLDSSVEALLASRAPTPPQVAAAIQSTREVPDWVRPLLWPCIVIAGVGLAFSVWVHVNALMGRVVAPSWVFGVLHVGIFTVWFPAVFVAQRRVRGVSRNDFWKAALRGLPDWIRYVFYALFAYVVMNFMLSAGLERAKGHITGTSPMEWRMFSGHWILFYAVALAILYSAATAASSDN